MSTRKKSKKPRRRGGALPRRSAILRYLGDHGEPLNESALFRAFGLRDTREREALRGRLQRMQADGQILRDRRERWALPASMDMVRGRVIGHNEGYGFLAPDQGTGDLFIPPNEMRKVLHGDRVLARVRGVDRRGRREAHIVEVIERGNHTVVGRYVQEKKIGFVIPDDTRINQDIFIPPEGRAGVRPGQIVVVEITRQPTPRFQPVGRIVEVLGEHMAPGMEIEIAIRKYELPHRWPAEVEKELAAVPDEVSEADCKGRVDLRHLPLVTIDGEDARDFDDAVCCEPHADGWRLWVSIADVSHYVATGNALDHEAYRRGNSVYFPQQVVPMLPEPLSNGICSLKPQVDRLCFTCEMDIARSGEIRSYRFYEAVMRSRARLTYTQVAAYLVDGSAPPAEHTPLLQPLQELYELFQVLQRRRSQRNSIDLELPETQIIFDAQRKIERIEPRERNDAHKLIEECMLAANICAADMLITRDAPGMFRVHDKPAPEKVADLRHFLRALGLHLGGDNEPGPEHYAAVVAASAERADAKVVQMALLMSMSRAVYSAENSGHFALAYDRYTHYTSPIRRYPDLYVHRVLKTLLKNGALEIDEYEMNRLETAAEHCSMTERRADDATRDVVQWLKAEYMLEHVGDEFTGAITNVTDFGIFVELEEVYVEGLVHVTALGNDYFRYDPVRRRLVGQRGGRQYALGGRVRVRVARVDLEQARIDFDLVDAGAKQRGRRRRRKN